ncbi:MAG: class I SAM-dependent methyltransferase [Bacteroidales bacterium]
MNPIFKLLKFFRSLVNMLGIDIHFIKARPSESALYLNSEEIANVNWQDPKVLNKFLDKERLSMFDDLVSLLQSKQVFIDNQPVADVGCGPGIFLKILAERINATDLTGYDFSENSLKIASKIFPGAYYIKHDIYQPVNNNYSLVTCTEVIEHLLDPEIALSNLIRMTAPGGWLLITVPDGRKDHFEGHINFWSPESWEHFIMKNADNCRFECGKIGRQNLYALLQKSEPLPEQPV